MSLRETLSAEHAELATLADRLLAIVGGMGPTDDFSRVRWQLNRILSIHLAREDRHLYPALRRSPNPTTRAMASRFEAQMGGLAAEHEAYCARWPIERVAAEWTLFAQETRQILKLLRTRIAREETQLYARLADADATVNGQAASRLPPDPLGSTQPSRCHPQTTAPPPSFRAAPSSHTGT